MKQYKKRIQARRRQADQRKYLRLHACYNDVRDHIPPLPFAASRTPNQNSSESQSQIATSSKSTQSRSTALIINPLLYTNTFVILMVYTLKHCPNADMTKLHEGLKIEHSASHPAFETRLNLKQTCVLGRDAAMEAWLKDFVERKKEYFITPTNWHL